MSCGIYGLKQFDGQRRDVEKPRQAKRCVRRFIFGGECVVVGVCCKTRIEPSVGTESRPKKACGGVKKLWPEGLWGWMCVFVCQQPITSHGFFSVSLSRGPRLRRIPLNLSRNVSVVAVITQRQTNNSNNKKNFRPFQFHSVPLPKIMFFSHPCTTCMRVSFERVFAVRALERRDDIGCVCVGL